MSGVIPVDTIGNSVASAFAVGPLSATAQTFAEYVGYGDSYDFYKITVTANSIVDFSFVANNPAGLDIGHSGLALYAANGTTQIAFDAFQTGDSSGEITKALGVGTYYLKVDNPNYAPLRPEVATTYTLKITAAPTTGNVTPAYITNALLPPNGSITFIDDSLEAEAGRLYKAAFGRDPDAAGLSFWAGSLRAGTPLTEIAAGFLDSPEFQARYGNPTNAGFVNSLYVNVLGRPGDAAGVAYWQGALDAGTISRPAVLVNFSEGAENKTNAAPSANAQSAARLYWSELGRGPDSAGLKYWTTQLSNGTATLVQEADALATSPEFVSRYGSLDDSAFVNLLYQNVLGRDADAAGLTFWTNALASGTTRGTAVTAFSEAPETKARYDFLDGKFGIVASS